MKAKAIRSAELGSGPRTHVAPSECCQHLCGASWHITLLFVSWARTPPKLSYNCPIRYGPRDTRTVGRYPRSLVRFSPDLIHATYNHPKLWVFVLLAAGLGLETVGQLIAMERTSGMTLRTNIKTRSTVGIILIRPDSRTVIGATVPIILVGIYPRGFSYISKPHR